MHHSGFITSLGQSTFNIWIFHSLYLNHFNTGQFYTFLPRPFFRFQRSHTLNDNCAV
ncbi:unnamed protein product, partial [Staurois parvus]